MKVYLATPMNGKPIIADIPYNIGENAYVSNPA